MVEMMKTRRTSKTFDMCLKRKLNKISHIFEYFLHKGLIRQKTTKKIRGEDPI
jgi:hypothetical protein